MKIRAPAKINLGLKILGKRSDGFHELETIFAEVGLFDELEFTLRRDEKIVVKFQAPNPKSQKNSKSQFPKITTQKNLVYRAAKILQKLAPRNSGVSISLTKNIPIGAGLGGGSSDAAATLRALNRIWNLRLSQKKLETLGATLGSDVPFFIRGGVKRGSGRGEKLRAFKLPKKFPRHVVLVVPKKIRVSTAWAYGRVKSEELRMKNKGLRMQDTDRENFEFRIRSVGNRKNPNTLNNPNNPIANDFEPIVFGKFPKLRQIKTALEQSGAEYVALSGSGSALYGLFTRPPRTENLARMKKELLDCLEVTKIVE